MTLSDLEGLTGFHYTLFYAMWHLWLPTLSNSLKLDPYCQRQQCSQENLYFGNMWFMGDDAYYLCVLDVQWSLEPNDFGLYLLCVKFRYIRNVCWMFTTHCAYSCRYICMFENLVFSQYVQSGPPNFAHDDHLDIFALAFLLIKELFLTDRKCFMHRI